MSTTTGMKRWENRVALVTGASDGTIGGAIALDLVRNGMITIGVARNISLVEKLKDVDSSILKKGKLIPYKCDLAKPDEIEKMFTWVKANYGGVDVMINNAGTSVMKPILGRVLHFSSTYFSKFTFIHLRCSFTCVLAEMGVEEMRTQLDLNVIALTLCCKLAINSMLERGINDGHVINMNSVLGHQVYGHLNFYAATKFAVTAVSEGLRKEMAKKGSFIKITQISPGRVETKFLYNSFGESEADKAKALYNSVKSMSPQDVSDAVIHALAAAPHVQVQDIIFNPIEPTPPGMMK
ncbi:Dehydrogenase/reductase SDR family member 11 [Orchesella cincta]|uniref:Dehydrogenase/reductase SDR family member 11 n=1 Tax=Orchesella cincta TaxID=48709 RepID=A0A1D2NCU9_ORCCI|nr:Dehydrogenase/reductase SDR family member 11 [Orchesella cincta]